MKSEEEKAAEAERRRRVRELEEKAAAIDLEMKGWPLHQQESWRVLRNALVAHYAISPHVAKLIITELYDENERRILAPILV